VVMSNTIEILVHKTPNRQVDFWPARQSLLAAMLTAMKCTTPEQRWSLLHVYLYDQVCRTYIRNKLQDMRNENLTKGRCGVINGFDLAIARPDQKRKVLGTTSVSSFLTTFRAVNGSFGLLTWHVNRYGVPFATAVYVRSIAASFARPGHSVVVLKVILIAFWLFGVEHKLKKGTDLSKSTKENRDGVAIYHRAVKDWVNAAIAIANNCGDALRALCGDESSEWNNKVYVLAKQCTSELPPELFAIKLGRHFVSFYDVVSSAPAPPPPLECTTHAPQPYVRHQAGPLLRDSSVHPHCGAASFSCTDHAPTLSIPPPPPPPSSPPHHQVTAASIRIVEQPWQRVHVGGQPHDHGFTLGRERRVAEVEVDAAGQHRVKAGVEEYSVLKTTQSGFEGFIRDQNTLLPDTRERILATTVQATWSYSRDPPCFNAAYSAAKAALTDTFFGPPQGGVYSPSVQRTLFLMGEEVLSRVPEADSVHLKLPNLHFIPVNLPGIGLK
ncbi:unnamed protein product, partial [Closterium sp. Naga37s-1]